MIITLPVRKKKSVLAADAVTQEKTSNLHLVIENLGLARLGFGDKRLIQDIEDILANFLELGLDLLTVITNGADVLI